MGLSNFVFDTVTNLSSDNFDGRYGLAISKKITG